MIDIKDVYERYLLRKREESREIADKQRPKDKPYYRVSSAGMCARKIYYETIMRLEPTEEIKDPEPLDLTLTFQMLSLLVFFEK